MNAEMVAIEKHVGCAMDIMKCCVLGNIFAPPTNSGRNQVLGTIIEQFALKIKDESLTGNDIDELINQLNAFAMAAKCELER